MRRRLQRLPDCVYTADGAGLTLGAAKASWPSRSQNGVVMAGFSISLAGGMNIMLAG
jgi:hypothetical protein